jgi:hypothetical protein
VQVTAYICSGLVWSALIGYSDGMEKLKAAVSVVDVPDGVKVTIEYEDGYTVRMSVGRDSLILRRYLGLDDPQDD